MHLLYRIICFHSDASRHIKKKKVPHQTALFDSYEIDKQNRRWREEKRRDRKQYRTHTHVINFIACEKRQKRTTFRSTHPSVCIFHLFSFFSLLLPLLLFRLCLCFADKCSFFIKINRRYFGKFLVNWKRNRIGSLWDGWKQEKNGKGRKKERVKWEKEWKECRFEVYTIGRNE